MKTRILIYTQILFILNTLSCQKKVEDLSSGLSTASKTLYVSTGTCNSGSGLTTYTTTASRTIERFDSISGVNKGYLVDYSSAGNFIPNTHPQNIIDQGDFLLVLNENATTTTERRVIRVPKSSPLSYVTHFANPTALSGIVRGMFLDADNNLLIGKTTAIEKVNSTLIRVPAGANPWVNAPAGGCATATTGMTSVVALPPYQSGLNGKIIFAHQGATAALNRIGIISPTGYFAASDCLAGVQISTTTHTKATNLASGTVTFNTNGTSPTSMVLIPVSSGTLTAKLIVSYSNGQTSNNNAGTYNLNHGIVAWDVNESSSTAATLTNPVVLYDNTNYIYGVSAMTYDPDTNLLYVATAGEPGATNFTTNGFGYNIEKFLVNINNPAQMTLSRVTLASQPFVKGGSNTRCISGMTLGQ